MRDLILEYIMSLEKDLILKDINLEAVSPSPYNDLIDVEIVNEIYFEDGTYYIHFRYRPAFIENGDIKYKNVQRNRSIDIDKNDLREFTLSKLGIHE
jgi:hypothetical protein